MIASSASRAEVVAVVGAGPAGLMAAIAAAQRGARVLVFDKLDRPGVKLLASGGGRCNLTNTLPAEAFMARFGRQGRFMAPALAAMDSAALRLMLDGLGVATASPDGLHVFPASNKAVTVQAALWQRCKDLGVQLHLGAEVTGLRVDGGRVAGIATAAGPADARRVVLAAGGRGYPALGGGAGGLALAAAAGHRIIEPTPALVPLVTAQDWPASLAGVSITAKIAIALSGWGGRGVTGDILFTHRGLSGPAVLDMSGDVAALLNKHPAVPLRLNLLPDVPTVGWGDRLEDWRSARGTKRVRNLLSQMLPASLAEQLCSQAGLGEDTRAAYLTAAQRQALIGMITAAPLDVVRTEGWDKAMVMRGGVALKEVAPETLESRLVGGLHLAGEMLDLDGPTGGFNLQWAFSSGNLAGASAVFP